MGVLGDEDAALELVKNLEEIMNVQAQVIFTEPRPGEILHSCASFERACRY